MDSIVRRCSIVPTEEGVLATELEDTAWWFGMWPERDTVEWVVYHCPDRNLSFERVATDTPAMYYYGFIVVFTQEK